MSPKKVIIDTDNTLGQSFRWNDDGLAIFYSFGNPELDIIGITTTFGNSTGKKTYKNTENLLKFIGRGQTPIKKGADKKGDKNTEASSFLAETSSSDPGNITLLALGPLTNLQGAYERDPAFFKNLKEIILMGGITKEYLEVGRIKMKDVNLKADLEAALAVLKADCPITVINCHICKQVPFRKNHMEKTDFWPDGIIEEINQEFWINKKVQQLDHIFIWDVLVPVYLLNPTFFKENKITIKAQSVDDINDGRLIATDTGDVKVNMPEQLINKEGFYEEIFATWRKLHNNILEKGGYNGDFGQGKIQQRIFKGLFSLLIPIALRFMYEKRDGFYYEK